MKDKVIFQVTQTQLDILGLSIYEYLSLFLEKSNTHPNIIFQSLISKGYIQSDQETEKKVTSCLSKSLIQNTIIESKNTFEEIASGIRELFPTGIKEGTNEPWRSSVAELTKRLQTLRSKIDFDLDKDKIIAATKNYIKSFGNDRRFMRTSKYFIFKNEIKANQVEFKSEMLAFMEMEENEVIDLNNNDWVSQLK